MKRLKGHAAKGKVQSRTSGSRHASRPSAETHLQNELGKPEVQAMWQDWVEWSKKAAAETLGHQQEAAQWWARFSQCWTNAECAPRKVQRLLQDLGSAWLAASEAGARLAMQQQQQAIALAKVNHRLLQGASPAEAQTFAVGLWSVWTDMARSWGMIPVAGQVRTASALAEFWSLPSAEGSARSVGG